MNGEEEQQRAAARAFCLWLPSLEGRAVTPGDASLLMRHEDTPW